MTVPSIRIFRYIDDLDCFVVDDTYRQIADSLGLFEWNPVVWIGRLFFLDNDYGEHWFDTWELREQLIPEAEKRGIPYEDLMVIDPERFKNDEDGPCHPANMRKRFWTDVLKSLELSYDLLFEEARSFNRDNQAQFPEYYIEDLEQRIETILKQANQNISD